LKSTKTWRLFSSKDELRRKYDASVSTLVLKDGEEKPQESHPHVTIRISPKEELLISCIQSAIKHLEKGEIPNRPPKSVEVRIAGGWVRDKLLGLSTYDVDLAIDILSASNLQLSCNRISSCGTLWKFIKSG
jgi:hypothetical protein